MYRDKTIGVVIPALNEAESTAGVIKRIPPVADWVVVRDNGSSDETGKVAPELN